ncbi:DUF3592 domain-containing protein [Pseudovibrio sp. Ad37]|uniref:DUF3592 domain-containing protein n=1 Tax=Pseudovibrio sp. Ad37 TaxID=989422 RepID=UPI0007AE518D|nr:DUF3592 domain-containing protein [Pseudovibrio sp. Ad37]KZL28934.1 hypothetical protein PsAD37_00727 [Pseudovibrio sp. Ad37]
MINRPTTLSDFIFKVISDLPRTIVILGVFFGSFGLWMEYSSRSATWDAAEVEVTVADVETELGENGRMYRPVFAFEESARQPVIYRGNTWVSPKPHEVGDVVTGFYNYETGEIVSLEMIERARYMGRILIVFGVVATLFGAFLLRWRKAKTPSKTLK